MGKGPPEHEGQVEKLSLSKSADYLLQETRTILPGIQALFGFQLIAVFNAAFSEKLTDVQQRVHIVALVLVAVATIIIMTPAAYHRQTHIREVTERFVAVASRLLLWSMIPLATGILIDIYLVSHAVFHDEWAAVLALATALVFLFFWVALPRLEVLKQLVLSPRDPPTAK